MKYQKKMNNTLALPVLLTTDYIMRIERKNYPQIYLEECKYRIKKAKMSIFIEAELKSESELESDTESL